VIREVRGKKGNGHDEFVGDVSMLIRTTEWFLAVTGKAELAIARPARTARSVFEVRTISLGAADANMHAENFTFYVKQKTLH
jgi:hypothetical protein